MKRHDRPLLWVAPSLLVASFFFVAVSSSQSYDLIFGQTLFRLNGGLFIEASTRTMFIADATNNRILIWHNIDTFTNTTPPDTVLGQPDLMTKTCGCSASKMCAPEGNLIVDPQGTLWATDSRNLRVLWWKNAASLSSGAPADGVIGQANFTTCSSENNGFLYPSDVSVHGSTLFVVDTGANSKILSFDGATLPSFPTQGAKANGIIGPAGFNNTGPNLFVSPYAAQATVDGLYVAEYIKQAVYYYTWEEANKTTGAYPAFVYGQQAINASTTFAPTRNSLRAPNYMAFDPSEKYFFICDYANVRVLLFAGPPTHNNQSAIDLFGPPDFESSANFYFPLGIAYDSTANNLWVIDYNTGRILRYPNALGGSFSTSNVPVDAQFQPRIPKLTLYPKQNGVSQTQVYATVQPTFIEELTSTGTVAQTVTLPDYGWDITSSVDNANTQHVSFFNPLKMSDTVPAPPDAEFTVGFSLFENQQIVNSAGVSFAIEGGAIKFDIKVARWNFTSSSNTLRVHVPIVVSPPSSYFVNSTSSNGVTSFSIKELTTGASTTLNAISMAVVDGINTPIRFNLESLGKTNNEETLDFVLDIPNFSSSFEYDPDLRVSLPSSASSASTLSSFLF